jgi:hypothetical protein
MTVEEVRDLLERSVPIPVDEEGTPISEEDRKQQNLPASAGTLPKVQTWALEA